MDLPHPGRRASFEVVRRNVERASRSLALEKARIRAGDGADIRDERGGIAHEPSDAELIPPAPNETSCGTFPFPGVGPELAL